VGSSFELSEPWKDGESRGKRGDRQKPRRRVKPEPEIVGGVTTEGRRRERDIRINIDKDCGRTIRYSEGGRRKRKARKGVI